MNTRINDINGAKIAGGGSMPSLPRSETIERNITTSATNAATERPDEMLAIHISTVVNILIPDAHYLIPWGDNSTIDISNLSNKHISCRLHDRHYCKHNIASSSAYKLAHRLWINEI